MKENLQEKQRQAKKIKDDIKKYGEYLRKAVYPIQAIIDAAKNKERAMFLGLEMIDFGTPKMRTFLNHGFVCGRCGKEGNFFALEIQRILLAPGGFEPNKGFHLTLYRQEGQNQIRFSSDHIIALKCDGPSNDIRNRQTLCEPCNSAKSAMPPSEKEALILIERGYNFFDGKFTNESKTHLPLTQLQTT